MADVNGDGWMDILCVTLAILKDPIRKMNSLSITVTWPLPNQPQHTGLMTMGIVRMPVFDYDLDGDLDCYILNNSYKDPGKISLYARERFKYDAPGGDRLFRNDGPGGIKSTNGKPVINLLMSRKTAASSAAILIWPGYFGRWYQQRWLSWHLHIQWLLGKDYLYLNQKKRDIQRSTFYR